MHDPTTCRQCDPIPPDAYRRHWTSDPPGHWHIIVDGPDLMARLPRQAHYATVLAYRLTADGRHYIGPLYWELDAADPAQALSDLRRCLRLIEIEYDLPLEAVRLWHSGGRGYHATIPPVAIGAAAGHPQLPRIYAAMVAELFPPTIAPTLDRAIYSAGMGRMWRLPNRRRSDTGRYKVPILLSEVLHQPAPALEALTQRPRHGRHWPADDDLSPCPTLVELYRKTMTMLEQTPPASPRVDADKPIPHGRRNATLTRMAGAMRRHGMCEAAILAALTVENQRCQPPLPAREVAAIAASIARYAPCGQRDPDALSHDPWLGPRATWHGVPAPIVKEVAR